MQIFQSDVNLISIAVDKFQPSNWPVTNSTWIQMANMDEKVTERGRGRRTSGA